MKQILVIFFLGMIISSFSAQAFSPQGRQDTVVVVVDSLDCYRYHVSHMTLLVKDKPVHYTVVFDTTKQYLRPQYRQTDGSIYSYSAIKGFGEKYRKGILVYEKEKEKEKNDE